MLVREAFMALIVNLNDVEKC